MGRVIVVACDSFKGSLSSLAVGEAFARGWASRVPGDTLDVLPIADGGEGTMAALQRAFPEGVARGAGWVYVAASDSRPATGIVELAATSGIELLDELRPLDADTRGFGEAIAAALDAGVERLVLGIGSSASTDGGVGMLRALGAEFRDAAAAPVASGARGLAHIVSGELSRLRAAPEVIVLTDVTNPLTGPDGAAAVYGPQKGLVAASDIAQTDAALERLAAILCVDPATPGAGAAGGTGAALLAWGARLVPGADYVAEAVGLRAAIARADLVVTGEGRFDAQSNRGKVVGRVQELAATAGVPVALVAGDITDDADARAFAQTISLVELAGSTDAAMADPVHWLEYAGAELATSARA